MIKIQDISKQFTIKNNIVKALSNINLEILEGDFFAIVGESGSGKTTLANIILGIYQQDEGDAVNMRGSRSDATEYYIDGIKVRGALGVPASGIEQITVVTGGVPAKYGDATGGIISVTTKGPSSRTNGGLEYETSSLFDD